MTKTSAKTVQYPYLPSRATIRYVSANHPVMHVAKEYARKHSLDKTMPTGSVVIKDGQIIGRGANGSRYHETHECERVKRGIPTGQGYELCAGCHPNNHSEPRAIAAARTQTDNLKGAELYLWGHWWCCKPCWDNMLASGITQVYLLEGSEVLFNKEVPGNIVGRQFIAKNANL